MRVYKRRARSAIAVLVLLVGGVYLLATLSTTAPLASVARAEHQITAGGCGDGSFCANLVGDAGGCKSRVCCETGETTCRFTASSFPFPSLKAVKGKQLGNCYSSGDTKQPTCKTTGCIDDLCGVGCTLESTSVISKKSVPLAGDQCGGETQ